MYAHNVYCVYSLFDSVLRPAHEIAIRNINTFKEYECIIMYLYIYRLTTDNNWSSMYIII